MIQNLSKEDLIARYDLMPHPEGGYFKEVFRSARGVELNDPVQGLTGYRNYLTGIYFLISGDSFSAFHRINQDESWHFYGGSPVTIYVISPNGEFYHVRLSADLSKDSEFQTTIPANHWFAAKVDDPSGFSFVGCNVAPGFDFIDFELAKRAELCATYPNHCEIITELTRI